MTKCYYNIRGGGISGLGFFTYIVALSFIDTRGKPPTCRKSLTNFITHFSGDSH